MKEKKTGVATPGFEPAPQLPPATKAAIHTVWTLWSCIILCLFVKEGDEKTNS